jgi:hypothetical protein
VSSLPVFQRSGWYDLLFVALVDQQRDTLGRFPKRKSLEGLEVGLKSPSQNQIQLDDVYSIV